MKILVTYSSKTGNTKKLAEGIFAGLDSKLDRFEKEIIPISEVASLEPYDIILAGYWVDKGSANEEAAAFLKSIHGKKVGLFATLAFWPDSKHAFGAIQAGEDMVREDNHIIGKFICQGKIDERMIAMFEKMPKDNPHYPSEEKRKRYKISANHPSAADIAAAAELFCERIEADV